MLVRTDIADANNRRFDAGDKLLERIQQKNCTETPEFRCQLWDTESASVTPGSRVLGPLAVRRYRLVGKVRELPLATLRYA